MELLSIPHEISYVLSGGTNSLHNPTSYCTKNPSTNIIDPTKPGSVFLGWIAVYGNATVVGSVTSYSIPSGSYGYLALVAIWS